MTYYSDLPHEEQLEQPRELVDLQVSPGLFRRILRQLSEFAQPPVDHMTMRNMHGELIEQLGYVVVNNSDKSS